MKLRSLTLLALLLAFNLVAQNIRVASLSTTGAVNTVNLSVTNNITYASALASSVSQATNFVADFTKASWTFGMTNAVWLHSVTNVSATNAATGWILVGRNYSGGALPVGMAATFNRIGTNNVSIGNNQKFLLALWPDGTGGSANSNFVAQISIADSP